MAYSEPIPCGVCHTYHFGFCTPSHVNLNITVNGEPLAQESQTSYLCYCRGKEGRVSIVGPIKKTRGEAENWAKSHIGDWSWVELGEESMGIV